MTQITTRVPVSADAAVITAIEAEGLATGHASFREVPHDWNSFQTSFENGRGLALVAEDGNGVAAWAGVSPTSARDVYRGVGEVSIYVSSSRQNRGIGQHLLKALLAASEQAGYWTLVAQIFPENTASLSLHTAAGFNVVGTRTQLGQMSYGPLAGRWCDVTLLERRSGRVG